MNFSVVMSVYINDRPDWLTQAINSILNQTVCSDDFVIVVDGPISPDLEAILGGYDHEESISLVRLETNQGLGNALNVGIAKAKHELIARMDADDISLPNRFELQLAEFIKNPKLDILGGQISEFDAQPEQVIGRRIVPVTKKEIVEFARRRSPFNHPTIMYKKSIIQEIGGYDTTAIRIEDYDLWLRALSHSVNCANLKETLVFFRSNKDSMRRRRSISSLRSHIKSRVRFYKRRQISFFDLVYGVSAQLILFLAPLTITGYLFRKYMRDV